jgi:hypothetical protein
MPTQGINGPFPFQTREYFDNAGDTNAAKGSTLTFAELDKTLLFLSASAASGGGDAVLTSNVTSNVTAGNITSGTTLATGTTFQQFVETLLITYIEPTITGVQIWNNNSQITSSSYDVGDTFDIDEVKWSTTNDNPDGKPPQYYGDITITVDGTSYNAGQNPSPFSLPSPQTINETSVTSAVINVSGEDKNGGSVSGNRTINFYFRNQFGGSSYNLTAGDNATAQLISDIIRANEVASNNVLTNSKAFNPVGSTYTKNPANRTYIIYPSSYGNLTQITKNGSLPTIDAWINLGNFTIDNVNGFSFSVKIYKSDQPGAYEATDTFQIT